VRIPLFHVDAFASQPVTGNPAAICFLDSWLDDEALRKVAAENNLSATAFLVAVNDTYELRWFTPRCEIKLCGHATLAAAYVVLNVLQPTLDAVEFATRYSGTLTVRKSNSFLHMDFPALFPKASSVIPAGLIQALGTQAIPMEILEVNNTYIIVFERPDSVRGLHPDFARLEEFHPYAVAATASGHDADFVSRYFAPSYGIPEDPVTGSAHCALTPYWAKRLSKAELHARQLSERGGELWCKLQEDRVILKGQAVLTMQGSLEI
jgi:PhzF family phenazine biosynthesis protein